ncbi:MAG: hypothetical protein B7Z37_27945 [Verrucomicrobia bacterium 12-59-8]|nr:MAG: hypothetical protein B7Z37_27945 [Verrucomicrobia bacterium 12-59-8]
MPKLVLGRTKEKVELEGLAGGLDAEHAAQYLVGLFLDAFGAGEVKGEGLQAVPEAVFPGVGKPAPEQLLVFHWLEKSQFDMTVSQNTSFH